jgi:hypothetical protein
MVDMFNVFNQGRAAYVQELSGTNFGKPLGVNTPRTFRAGARFWF